MDQLTIDVLGVPAPQGSKKGFINPRTQRVVVVDDNKKPLKNWRQDVRAAAVTAMADEWAKLDCPVWVQVVFFLRRPAGHYGTGRNAGVLKASAPAYPSTKPDVDKLLRSTLDGLTEAGCYADDARVVSIQVDKAYADQREPGARIVLAPMDLALADFPPEADAPTSVQEALL